MIAGNDRADLVAGGVGARRILDAPGRGDDELVGGEHQVGRRRSLRGRRRATQSRRWRSW